MKSQPSSCEKEKARSSRFDANSLLRADTGSRCEFYQSALQSGWMSINEVRAKEGLNPIGPSGDVHLVQVNQLPVSSIRAMQTASPTIQEVNHDRLPNQRR